MAITGICLTPVARADAKFVRTEGGSEYVEIRIDHNTLTLWPDWPTDSLPRLRAYAEAIEAVNRRFDAAESAQEAAE